MDTPHYHLGIFGFWQHIIAVHENHKTTRKIDKYCAVDPKHRAAIQKINRRVTEQLYEIGNGINDQYSTDQCDGIRAEDKNTLYKNTIEDGKNDHQAR